MKRILISGYIGFNNFGDEAIFQALLSYLRTKRCKIRVLCNKENNKYDDVKMYDYKSLKEVFKAVFFSSVLISGGGSLLQNKTSNKSLIYYLLVIFLAKLLFKKVIIFAQGIEPIKGNFYQKLTKKILKMANLITVRDENSHNLLKEWGIKSEIVSDPAYYLVQNMKIEENKEGLIVQLRDFKGLREEFLSLLAIAIKKNFDGEIKVLSLHNEYDKIPCLYFIEQLKKLGISPEFVKFADVNSTINLFNKSKYVISTRLHGLIVGNALGARTLALKYDDKIHTLAKELNLNEIDLLNYKDEEIEQKISLLFNEEEYKTNPYRRFYWDIIDKKLKLKDKKC